MANPITIKAVALNNLPATEAEIDTWFNSLEVVELVSVNRFQAVELTETQIAECEAWDNDDWYNPLWDNKDYVDLMTDRNFRG